SPADRAPRAARRRWHVQMCADAPAGSVGAWKRVDWPPAAQARDPVSRAASARGGEVAEYRHAAPGGCARYGEVPGAGDGTRDHHGLVVAGMRRLEVVTAGAGRGALLHVQRDVALAARGAQTEAERPGRHLELVDRVRARLAGLTGQRQAVAQHDGRVRFARLVAATGHG